MADWRWLSTPLVALQEVKPGFMDDVVFERDDQK